MTYVYVASSWRNLWQPKVIRALLAAGIDCYDFRNPAEGSVGFSWRETKSNGAPTSVPLKGSDWETAETYLKMIQHPRAEEGFTADLEAMKRADVILMVLPCGKSAHLEMGWCAGRGKWVVILLEDPVEPELMYKVADYMTTSIQDAVSFIAKAQVSKRV